MNVSYQVAFIGNSIFSPYSINWNPEPRPKNTMPHTVRYIAQYKKLKNIAVATDDMVRELQDLDITPDLDTKITIEVTQKGQDGFEYYYEVPVRFSALKQLFVKEQRNLAYALRFMKKDILPHLNNVVPFQKLTKNGFKKAL